MTPLLLKWTILLALTISFTACNGQVKKQISKETITESKIIAVGQPKLVTSKNAHEGDNVHCSLQDKAGNLWFGTTADGIYKYDGKSFTKFTSSDGLYDNTVWCVFEDRAGKIWVGTDTGASYYDGNTFTKIQINRLNSHNFFSTTLQNQPQINSVFDIMQDKSGKLWFSTLNGVYIYDGNTFTPFVVKEGARGYRSPNHNVERILEDSAGNVWFGGRVNEGVFRHDARLPSGQGNSLTNLPLKALNGHNWAWPVLADKNGHIWFSNWGGAYRYDGNSFTTFTKKDGLASDIITRIIEDKNDNLWFGCGGENGGLCRYDGKSFTCFTTKDGLINNKIWTILEDRTGHIWVGTRNNGLSRFDGETFTTFSAKSGSLSGDK